MKRTPLSVLTSIAVLLTATSALAPFRHADTINLPISFIPKPSLQPSVTTKDGMRNWGLKPKSYPFKTLWAVRR